MGGEACCVRREGEGEAYARTVSGNTRRRWGKKVRDVSRRLCNADGTCTANKNWGKHLCTNELEGRPGANQAFVFPHNVALFVAASGALRVEHLLRLLRLL